MIRIRVRVISLWFERCKTHNPRAEKEAEAVGAYRSQHQARSADDPRRRQAYGRAQSKLESHLCVIECMFAEFESQILILSDQLLSIYPSPI